MRQTNWRIASALALACGISLLTMARADEFTDGPRRIDEIEEVRAEVAKYTATYAEADRLYQTAVSDLAKKQETYDKAVENQRLRQEGYDNAVKMTGKDGSLLPSFEAALRQATAERLEAKMALDAARSERDQRAGTIQLLKRNHLNQILILRLADKVDVMQKQRDTTQADVGQLRSDLTIKTTKYEREIKQLDERLSGRIDTLRSDLTKETEERKNEDSRLEDRINAQQKQIDKLMGRCERLTVKYERDAIDLSQLMSAIDAVRRTSNASEQKLQELKDLLEWKMRNVETVPTPVLPPNCSIQTVPLQAIQTMPAAQPVYYQVAYQPPPVQTVPIGVPMQASAGKQYHPFVAAWFPRAALIHRRNHGK